MPTDRTNCCADWVKPCSYHEGWEDAWEAARDEIAGIEHQVSMAYDDLTCGAISKWDTMAAAVVAEHNERCWYKEASDDAERLRDALAEIAEWTPAHTCPTCTSAALYAVQEIADTALNPPRDDDRHTPIVQAGSNMCVCGYPMADESVHLTRAALAPTEVYEKGRGVGVGCSSCDSATWLPEVPGGGGVLTEPLNGWYFTSDTGWLCPKCAPTEPQGGE